MFYVAFAGMIETLCITRSPVCLSLQRFLEGLLEAYSADVEEHSAERAVLLAAAAAELLQAHALLAEHAVALGYVDKLLKVLQAHVPSSEGAPLGFKSLWSAAPLLSNLPDCAEDL